MLNNPSYLKGAVAILVFVALFASYQVPIPSVQKIVQVGCLALALAFMFFIMKSPTEKNKKWLNITLSVLLFASMVAYAIAK